MNKAVLLLFLAIALFAVPSYGGEPGLAPASNAAELYLQAIGCMASPQIPVQREIDEIDSFDRFQKVSSETIGFLVNPKHLDLIRLLEQGSRCPTCQFKPRQTYRPDEPAPPYRRIKKMAQLARAIGFHKLREGKENEALEIFQALFRLGLHLDQVGPLNAGMIGHTAKKFALIGLEGLLQEASDVMVKERIRTFLKGLSPSTTMTRRMIEDEKKLILASIDMIKNSPDPTPADLETVKKLVSPNAVGENGSAASEPVPPLKVCAANQRILLGALEMMSMDLAPLPATLTIDLLPEFLVKAHYLKSFPVCPEGGKYEISSVPDLSFSCRCTTHPAPDAIPPQPKKAASAKDIGDFQGFVTGPEFTGAVKALTDMVDEALTWDPSKPDFKETLAKLQERAEKSTIPLVKGNLTKFVKMYSLQLELDENIKDLLKGS